MNGGVRRKLCEKLPFSLFLLIGLEQVKEKIFFSHNL